MATADNPAEEPSPNTPYVPPNIGPTLSAGRDLEVEVGRDFVSGDAFTGDKLQAGGDIIKGDRYDNAQIINYYGIPPSNVEDKEPTPTTAPPPYKGMQAYQVGDAHLFFGRETITAQLVSHLRQSNILVVVGATSIGKTSLIRAGVVAALQNNTLLADGTVPAAGSEYWPIHLIDPTANPLESLAATLTRDNESVTAAFTLADDLAKDERSLSLMARRLVNNVGADKLLLVVDHFEDIFTVCTNLEWRQKFLENLYHATHPTHGVVTLIVGLRVAYLPMLEQLGEFGQILHKNIHFVGPLTPDQTRGVIEKPAAVGDENGAWEYEDNLVDFLMREINNEPYSLPWLSHILLEVWKRRRGRVMTFSGYTEALGIEGAILRRAVAIYQQFDEEEKQLARSAFLRLTELGEGTRDSRRVAPMSEIMPHGPQQSARLLTVLTHLADARLVTVDNDGMQVIHEGLIRNWMPLRQWVVENRAGLRVQRQLAADVARWVRLNRDPGSLYRGARLEQTMEWAADNPTEFNPVEQEFLEASWQAAENERLAQEEFQRRELESAQQLAESANQLAEAARQRAEEQAAVAEQRQQTAERIKRGAQWLGAISVFAIILLIAATFLGISARRSTQRAEEKSALANQLALESQQKQRLTRARELAALGQSVLYDYPQRALLLAVEAYRVLEANDPRVPAVEEALRVGLAETGGRTLRLVDVASEQQTITAVAIAPNGQWLVTGTQNGNIYLWDQANLTQAPRRLYSDQVIGGVLDIAIAPDSEWLYASYDGNLVLEWDLLDFEAEPFVISGSYNAYQLSLAVGDTWLATGGDDGIVTVWRRDDFGGDPIRLRYHDGPVYTVDLSDDESMLLTGGGDGNVYLYDMLTLAREGDEADPTLLDAHNEQVFAVEISPDNQTIVTAGGTPPWIALNALDAVAFVWDVNDLSEPIYTLKDHDGYITSIDISADSRWLVTASWDHTARLYDLEDLATEPFVLRGHEEQVVDAVFDSTGHYILTGSGDETVRLWQLSNNNAGIVASPIILHEHDTPMDNVQVSPDSKWVATGSEDGQVWLWNLAADNPELASIEILPPQRVAKSSAFRFSPDGQWLATGHAGGLIQLWDLTRDDPSARFVRLEGNAPQDSIADLAYSPDGRWLVGGTAAGALWAWDMDHKTQPAYLIRPPDGQTIQQIAFSTGQDPTRQETISWLIAAVAPADQRTPVPLLLWPTGDWADAQPTILRGHTDIINSLAVSADGHWLVSGSGDSTVRRWDLFNPTAEALVLTDYPDGVRKVALSPNGRWLAVGGWSPDLYLWDFTNLTAAPLIFRDHDAWVNDLSFSANSEWLATASYDSTARLWYMDTAPDLTSVALVAHDFGVNQALFSPDNHWLITGGDDTSALVWSLRLQDLVDLACSTAGRNLNNSRDEWQRYFGDEAYRATCPQWPTDTTPDLSLTEQAGP